MVPVRHTKVVHLIRHGEGEHNLAVERAGGRELPSAHALYKSWEYEDAQLTARGWEQVLPCSVGCGGLDGPWC